MTFTLRAAMKYSAALQKMGCGSQTPMNKSFPGVFSVDEEEAAIS